MSFWWSRTISKPSLQLATTAVVSGAIVAGVILGYQQLKHREKVEELKREIPAWATDGEQLIGLDVMASEPQFISKEDQRSVALAEKAQRGNYSDELILEQLARNRAFLTDSGLQKFRNAFVIIVGCGGVGSHCASALVRSGISRIRLIDFDQVTLSSLNRHAVATLADVGTPKVVCLKKRLQQIAPWVQFDLRNELYHHESSDKLLAEWEGYYPDFIVDAIDNIDSKVALLKYCHERQHSIISSMGAGAKSDPTRIFIGDISSSTEDPLSRATRRRLRAAGIVSGIPVVFSTEKPGPGKAQLLPLSDEQHAQGTVGELGVLPDFRVRILPVLGTMPAVFGYAVANHIILQISGYPTNYVMAKGREKMYDSIHAQLQGAEEKLARARMPGEAARGLKLPITAMDVGYIVEEIFKGRSAISRLPTRLALVRWRKPEANFIDQSVPHQLASTLTLRDLVCLTKEEAIVHTREVHEGTKAPEDLYSPHEIAYVEARFQEEILFEKYR